MRITVITVACLLSGCLMDKLLTVAWRLQEHFALQLITLFDQIFKKAGLNLDIATYHVLATGPDAGV